MRRLSLFTLVVLCSAASSTSVQANGGSRACSRTTQMMKQSCRNAARSDYWLTLANCENILDSEERLECRTEAFEDLREAFGECTEQRRLREELCEEIGEDRYCPEIDPENFVEEIDNPYFPLPVGKTWVYEGDTDEGPEVIVVTVTHRKREILGVECTEVRDVVRVDGEIVEDTVDYYAQDLEGNVWYFGELSFEIEGGEIANLEGSWESGVDSAKPGIIMLAHPEVGAVYRQEVLRGEAEDMARILGVDESLTIGIGSYDGVVRTGEFTPLEADVDEQKFYAAGVGLLAERNIESGESVELVKCLEPGEVEEALFSIDYTAAAGTAQMELKLEGGGEVFRFQIFGPEDDLKFEAECFLPMQAGAEGLDLDSFDAPLADLLAAWPEGEYLVVAWGLDGTLYMGDGSVDHDLLDAVEITVPADGAEGVATDAFTVQWGAVEGAELYRVEVEEEDGDTSVSSIVPGDTTSIAMDPAFFKAGTEYEIDLEVVGENGNVTSTSISFTTAE